MVVLFVGVGSGRANGVEWRVVLVAVLAVWGALVVLVNFGVRWKFLAACLAAFEVVLLRADLGFVSDTQARAAD